MPDTLMSNLLLKMVTSHRCKMPPDRDLPSFTIESIHGSEEETAKAEIELYGSTNIKPQKPNKKTNHE